MLLRVALQTTLARPGDKRYKMFMVYFMAFILRLATQNDLPSDILHIMLTKMNRRIRKLNLVPDEFPWAEQAQEIVNENMEAARRLLSKRWSTVQKSIDSAGTFRLAELRKLRPHSDTILRLSNLR